MNVRCFVGLCLLTKIKQGKKNNKNYPKNEVPSTIVKCIHIYSIFRIYRLYLGTLYRATDSDASWIIDQ